jgi:hypothetical protein
MPDTAAQRIVSYSIAVGVFVLPEPGRSMLLVSIRVI